MYRFLSVIGLALLALCLSGFPDGRVRDIGSKDFCEALNGEIMVTRWGDTLRVSEIASRYDVPVTPIRCDGPVIIASQRVIVDFEGLTLEVDGPHPGVILGTWETKYHVERAGVRNLDIVFTERATAGLECWDNDCSNVVFGTPSATRNNGISGHHCPHCTVENVTVRGGPSGGIIFADTHYALVRNAEVSGARFDGVGCNATYMVRFENVRVHHNGHAGITVDLNGSCEFVNVVSSHNGHHGLYARDTYDPVKIIGSTFADNADTGIFLDRSVPGNAKTCVLDLSIQDSVIEGGNMAVWVDPECHRVPDAVRVAESKFSANTPACAQEAVRLEYPGIDAACPIMPETPIADIPHGSPS